MTEESNLFNRKIEVDVADEDGTLRMTGRLADRRFGDPLHVIEVDMLVEPMQGTILDVSGRFPTWPMSECEKGLESLGELVGTDIKPGFTDFVKSTVGSRRGCTHLAALVMTMGNVAVQGRGAFLRKYVPDDAERARAMEYSARQLGLIDSCVSWATDGPILSKYREGRDESPR